MVPLRKKRALFVSKILLNLGLYSFSVIYSLSREERIYGHGENSR